MIEHYEKAAPPPKAPMRRDSSFAPAGLRAVPQGSCGHETWHPKVPGWRPPPDEVLSSQGWPLANTDLSWLMRVREQELEEARYLQRRMVPAEPLQHPAVELTCKFRPLAQVGGDFLDFFRLNNEQIGFYLGDVAGKGLPAAFYGALVAGTLRGMHKSGVPPALLLEMLNDRLRIRAIPGRYCAVQYGVFHVSSHELRYATAGLPPPLHITSRGCRQLDGTGLPSAMFDHARYDPYTVRLTAGDSVFFTTDGLLEARNPERNEFGSERLAAVCAQNAGVPAAILLSRVFAAADAFTGTARQYDDITAAVLKVA